MTELTAVLDANSALQEWVDEHGAAIPEALLKLVSDIDWACLAVEGTVDLDSLAAERAELDAALGQEEFPDEFVELAKRLSETLRGE